MNNSDYFSKANELARKAGISLAQLCRRAGVSRGTLTRWSTGATQPTMRVWSKLEEAAKAVAK